MIEISEINRKRIILANDRLEKKEFFITGLICAVTFESIVEELWKNFDSCDPSVQGKGHMIDFMEEDGYIDQSVTNKLHQARECRNAIVHDNERQKKKCAARYNALNCEQALLSILCFLSGDSSEVDYEQLAKIEEHFFPGSWLKIGGTLPDAITAHHFAHLKDAATQYMAPLGQYLTKNCLNKHGGDFEFQTISRVDYTSGYVWLSAVKKYTNTREYRTRVALPGLTIVLKPTGIHVYIELPGKSIEYKKMYYEQLLSKRELKSFLELSPTLKQKKGYRFFHTWWFADIEFIRDKKSNISGETNRYLTQAKKNDLLKKIRNEWEFERHIEERLEEIKLYEQNDSSVPALTRNSFLVGKFYSREDCLNKYSKELPELISEDFKVLFPLIKELYRRVEQKLI